jgi:adenylate cyclase class 1
MDLYRTLTNNKNIFLEYNRFRKRIFTQLAPKDSEYLLYLLPWLLSVNRPSIPGYIEHIKHNFRVFNIEAENEILKREPVFKNMFHIRSDAPILKLTDKGLLIEGIYTIGSIGTISQTSHSDCDLWICIDKSQYDKTSYAQFLEKTKLIEKWLNENIKIPVHFFISDIGDVRRCNFGGVDYESCGSTQKKVLKEEFYRTTIIIAGKIPLWWVCYNPQKTLNYEEVVHTCQSAPSVYYDFIDMGDLDFIDKDESFGAALWQFNKSLTHPLKSIIKMLLLKMFLESPKEDLLCHRFRRFILSQTSKPYSFSDPSVFTLTSVMDHCQSQDIDTQTFKFIIKCFYLRYEVKLFSKTMTIKEETALELFRKYKLDRETMYELNRFANWSYSSQIQFGNLIIMLLVDIYKDISHMARNVTGNVAPQDLTILGRKLSASLEKKTYKIQPLHKPLDTLNLPTLTLCFNNGLWQVVPENNSAKVIVEKSDLVHCLAYLSWNGLYFPGQLRMLPNKTYATMPEIINLIRKINEIFGVHDVSSIDFENFLKPEHIEKLFVIINFATNPNADDIRHLSVISINNWGELFVNHFKQLERFNSFLEKLSESSYYVEKFFYAPRDASHYSKILIKSKYLVSQYLADKNE